MLVFFLYKVFCVTANCKYLTAEAADFLTLKNTIFYYYIHFLVCMLMWNLLF